jgi:hypothetical protein
LIDTFGSGLILPVLALALLGWAVPRALARVFPEGVWPLVLLGFFSTLVMLVLAAVTFMALYSLQGVPVAVLFDAGLAAGIVHFGRLGLGSALIWAPVMVLTVAGLPKRWKHETW